MSPVSALALEAAGQWGLFTTEQAGRIGMDGKAVSALVAAGRVLATETEDVFRFAGAPIDVMLDPLRTSWLALVPRKFLGERVRGAKDGDWDDAVVSHVAAANLVYELGTLQADRFEFSAITPLPASDRILEIHVRPRMPKWRFQNGLPVTTVPQTIADLYSEHIDYGHVGIVILDALLASSADFLDITEEMDSITDGSGRAIVLHMLDVVGAPTRLVTALVHLAEMKRESFRNPGGH
ncbi:type IV toxin-antitoxin system AbiEi family antitoxin domain-containing protein [Mycolicibacterium sarraceniae]|uniref:AbiEi antitoxin C-terminal domain-containing protein n=1 Tax=Mycolicibacterium sarraceniae TaxID=1534348 RepID=A0A7I7SUI2_9MYCO|nr:type IV toxin-antitoxin system AbiEi family antitoxin domain-containing protein [Mycolicibacterium sarraceniae]BBY60677.1 hypothetical protein MSAR_38130 [Mycolicibacterium sarraceniae]